MDNWSNTYTCEHCGSTEYTSSITTDGYREYRCAHCGAIIHRVNLLEEYHKFDIHHVSYTKDTSLDELNALLAKYKDDASAIHNFIGYLDYCLAKCPRSLLNVSPEEEAYYKLIEEFRAAYSSASKYTSNIKERITALEKELTYERIKQKAISEYDSTKQYKMVDTLTAEAANTTEAECKANSKYFALSFIAIMAGCMILAGIVLGICLPSL